MSVRRGAGTASTAAAAAASAGCFKNIVISMWASGVDDAVAAAGRGRRMYDGAQVVRVRMRRIVMVTGVAAVHEAAVAAAAAAAAAAADATVSMVLLLCEMCANRCNEWHFDQAHVQADAIAIVNAHRLHWKYIHNMYTLCGHGHPNTRTRTHTNALDARALWNASERARIGH